MLEELARMMRRKLEWFRNPKIGRSGRRRSDANIKTLGGASDLPRPEVVERPAPKTGSHSCAYRLRTLLAISVLFGVFLNSSPRRDTLSPTASPLTPEAPSNLV